MWVAPDSEGVLRRQTLVHQDQAQARARGWWAPEDVLQLGRFRLLLGLILIALLASCSLPVDSGTPNRSRRCLWGRPMYTSCAGSHDTDRACRFVHFFRKNAYRTL
jgi:hypothetical protein